jgi:hypothetical protein
VVAVLLCSCLLGVCTTDFRIKLYRAPFCDYKAEWVEVADLSELIYAYCLEKEFKETEVWLPEWMWEMKLNLLALGTKTRKGMWQLMSLSTGK